FARKCDTSASGGSDKIDMVDARAGMGVHDLLDIVAAGQALAVSQNDVDRIPYGDQKAKVGRPVHPANAWHRTGREFTDYGGPITPEQPLASLQRAVLGTLHVYLDKVDTTVGQEHVVQLETGNGARLQHSLCIVREVR